MICGTGSAWFDANARVGNTPSTVISDYKAEEQDVNGDYFHDFVIQNRLWCPSTFERFHDGSSGTWQHPRSQTWHRCDFVCLPQSWDIDFCYSWVNDSIDLSLKRDDHRVACVRVVLTVLHQPEAWRHRTPRYNVEALSQDMRYNYYEVAKDLQENLPVATWETDVHTHLHNLQGAMQKWLQRWYPPQKKSPKRKHVSEATWTVVQQKQLCRKNIEATKKARRQHTLAHWFQCWLRGRTVEERPTKPLDLLLAKQESEFKCISRKVTAMLRADDKAYFDRLAGTIGEGPPSTLWRRVKWALPKVQAKARLSPMKLEALDDQWKPYFAALEAGEERSLGDLVHCCQMRQLHNCQQRISPALSEVPTLGQVEAVLRATSLHRTPGPDGIPGDLLHLAAAELAPLVHDFFLKETIWTMEAVQAKGGQMTPIYKRGMMLKAASYRGIMLLGSIPKSYHAWLRTRTMQCIEDVHSDSQLGGFAAQQVSFGCQLVQGVAAAAKAAGLPSACLFVDVRSAYHHLIRELVMGIDLPADYDTVLQCLQEQGLPTNGVQQWMKIPDILRRIGAPEHLIRLLREVHSDTWLTMPCFDDVLRTNRGSRPGSPLADAIFHVPMVDLHHEADRIVADIADADQAFKSIGLTPSAVTWADDIAIPLLAISNEQLIGILKEAATRLYKAFRNRGLQLNMDRFKTTAILGFRGAGAAAFRRDYLLVDKPSCALEVGNSEHPPWLHFASSYRHLGALYVADGDQSYEVRVRIGMANEAYQLLRKKLFGNKHLDKRSRLQLFNALIIPKLFFGAGTWGFLPPGTFHAVETFLQRCYGYICGLHRDRGPVRGQLHGLHRQPTFEQRLFRYRLLYAGKVWSTGPATLQHLMLQLYKDDPTSWLAHVVQDMRWMQALLGDEFPFHPERVDDAARFWSNCPDLWRRMVLKAYRVSHLQEGTAHEVRYWHSRVLGEFRLAGVTMENVQEECADGDDGLYVCECGQTFTRRQGLGVHRYKKHGIKAPERRLVDSSVCPICMKQFWTLARNQQHLSYIPRGGGVNRCYAALMEQRHVAGDPVCQDIPKHLQGIRRLEAVQLAGPQPQARMTLGDEVRIAEEHLQRLVDKKNAQEQWFKSSPDYVSMLCQRLEEATQRCFLTFQSELNPETLGCELQGAWCTILHEQFEKEDPDLLYYLFMVWGQDNLPAVYAEWEDGEAEQVAEDAYSEIVTEAPCYDLTMQIVKAESQLQRLAQQQAELAVPHRPAKFGPRVKYGPRKNVRKAWRLYVDDDGWARGWQNYVIKDYGATPTMPFYRTIEVQPCFLVLHMFSGRRRSTDLHAALEEMTANLPYSVHVLSCDTAIDEHYGNLLGTGHSWRQIEELLKKGMISCCVSGAPCETFTEARHWLPDDPGVDTSRWPRPLRSSDWPWGLEGLVLRELLQLGVGSSFSLQTLWVMANLLRVGGTMLSEHPPPPRLPERASIFTTPLVRLMRTLPEIFLHILPQGWWGAKSKKPTGLLTLRLPRLKASMYKWRLDEIPTEYETAIGRTASGSFKTASLKEYPCRFSFGMAQAIVDDLSSKVREGHVRPAPEKLPPATELWVDKLLEISSLIRTDATMQADFQPERM